MSFTLYVCVCAREYKEQEKKTENLFMPSQKWMEMSFRVNHTMLRYNVNMPKIVRLRNVPSMVYVCTAMALIALSQKAQRPVVFTLLAFILVLLLHGTCKSLQIQSKN